MAVALILYIDGADNENSYLRVSMQERRKGREQIRMGEIYTFGVKTGQVNAMVNITSEINKAINESGVRDGICVVFIPHTTAGIIVSENADPDAVRNFIMDMNKIIPVNDNLKHITDNSSAQTKATLAGSSLTLVIDDGRLLLGTWQGIYFLEFDGPRIRKVHVKILES